MAIIIVPPVVPTNIEECLFYSGKKYCEKSDLTIHEFGVDLLGVLIFILFWGGYMGFWIWISDRYDRPILSASLAIITLIIILSIALINCGG